MESGYLYSSHDWKNGGEKKTFHSYEKAINYLIRDHSDVFPLPFDYLKVPFDSNLAGHDFARRLVQKQVKHKDRRYSDIYGTIEIVNMVWIDK